MAAEKETPKAGEDRGPSQTTLLRAVLDEHFALLRSTDGRMFGVESGDPVRALPHSGYGSRLMNRAAVLFDALHGKFPNSTARSDCAAYLAARFDDVPTGPVPQRAYWDRSAGAIYLDVLDEPGSVLQVDDAGVRPTTEPPVPFRRGNAAGPLAWSPDVAPDLSQLWDIVPVVEKDRSIVLAALIMSWLTETPQPIMLITGPEDSGKTTTAQFLISLVDPSTGPRGRALPSDEREWKAAVSPYRVVLVDNLSGLNAESSDVLCRVATGGEAASRALYTDDDAHVSNLYVPVWLTSIDPGALRGDLASRLVKIELLPLSSESRSAPSDLARRQAAARPAIVAGLLELASNVLAAWSTIPREGLAHRMGDFALVLRAVDQITGANGEQRLAVEAEELARDVVDANPLALAVVEQARRQRGEVRRWLPVELLDALQKVHREAGHWDLPKGWPQTPSVFSAQLKRLGRALREGHGIEVERVKSNGVRMIEIRPKGATDDVRDPF